MEDTVSALQSYLERVHGHDLDLVVFVDYQDMVRRLDLPGWEGELESNPDEFIKQFSVAASHIRNTHLGYSLSCEIEVCQGFPRQSTH